MAKCWEKRGCDEEMQSRCVHQDPDDKCPSKCAFAKCDRPTCAQPSDPLTYLDPLVDRSATIREECMYCDFFLTNGPRITPAE